MNWADYAVLGIIGISALVSVVRGFVREALSLAGWAAAIWVSLSFMEDVARPLAAYISAPSVRRGIAFFALFVATLIVTALVNLLAGKLVERSGLTATDRALGVVFGLARGAAIVVALVLLAGLTALPRDPWWHESALLGHFQVLALQARAILPNEIAAQIRY